MTKDKLATISLSQLDDVTGGWGGRWANRFPIAAAGMRRLWFGPGANARGARIGCPGGNCGE
jgi:hypothetical protein